MSLREVGYWVCAGDFCLGCWVGLDVGAFGFSGWVDREDGGIGSSRGSWWFRVSRLRGNEGS